MPNLPQSIKIVKNATKIALIFLVVITFATLIFLRYQKPQEKVQQNPAPTLPHIFQDPRQKQIQSIDFSNVQIGDIPSQLAAYQAQEYNFTDKNYADIALVFDIKNQPFLVENQTIYGKQVTWQQDKATLSVNQQSLRYQNKNFEPKTSNPSEDQIKQKAQELISALPIIGSDLSFRSIAFLKISPSSSSDSYFISASSFEDAQILELLYDKKLSEYPTYEGPPTNSYTTLRITKDGTLIYFSSKIFQTFSQIGSYNLKSAKEAINEIQLGQGKVVQNLLLDQNGQAQELFRSQPQSLTSTSIKTLSLAYLLPTDITSLIQPVFVAEGESQDDKNQTEKIVIYLPAFK